MRRSSQKRRNLVIELRRVTTDRYVDIPGGVLDVYRLWRPSPMFRAHRLEQALDTPARLHYKYEGVSPAGSHQTIIGEEALLQMAMIGEVPDVLVGCTGGGSNFGGLRYHGMAPLVSHIYELGLAEAEAIPQTECFAGALTFARCEGIVPAPEPTHAIAAAIREAQRCKESGEEKSDELSSALSTVPVLA